jgi:hypothetical protein
MSLISCSVAMAAYAIAYRGLLWTLGQQTEFCVPLILRTMAPHLKLGVGRYAKMVHMQ